MKRPLAKIAFQVALVILAIVVGHLTSEQLGNWAIGLGGGLGALALMFGGRLFDRIWPERQTELDV